MFNPLKNQLWIKNCQIASLLEVRIKNPYALQLNSNALMILISASPRTIFRNL